MLTLNAVACCLYYDRLVIHHCSVLVRWCFSGYPHPLGPNGGWAGGVWVRGGVRVSTSTVCQGMLKNAGISKLCCTQLNHCYRYQFLLSTGDLSHSVLQDRSVDTSAFISPSICPSPPHPSWMSVYSQCSRHVWGILSRWQKSNGSNTFNSALILSVVVCSLMTRGVSLYSHASAFVLIVCMCASLSPQQCGWNRNYTWVGGKAEKEVGESREAGRGRR